MNARARRIVTRESCPPVVVACVWPLLSGRPHNATQLWVFPLVSETPQPLCELHAPDAVAYYTDRLDADPATAARRVDLVGAP